MSRIVRFRITCLSLIALLLLASLRFSETISFHALLVGSAFFALSFELNAIILEGLMRETLNSRRVRLAVILKLINLAGFLYLLSRQNQFELLSMLLGFLVFLPGSLVLVVWERVSERPER